jgi:DNA-binding NarL/FixJ family response regulator
VIMTKAASALVASSDPVFREKAVKAMEHAGIPLVAQAANDPHLPALIGAFPTDLLLLDAEPFGAEAADRLSGIHLASPGTAIVLALGVLSDEYLESALLHGVRGFVSKAGDGRELASAIEAVLGGEIWLSRGKLSHALLTCIEHKPIRASAGPATRAGERLSRREREIVRLIALGRTNKEIAKVLGTSDKTVKAHVSHVLARLGLSRRTQITGHPQFSASATAAKATQALPEASEAALPDDD